MGLYSILACMACTLCSCFSFLLSVNQVNHRGVFKIPSNIYDGVFFVENSLWLLAVNYFRKKLRRSVWQRSHWTITALGSFTSNLRIGQGTGFTVKSLLITLKESPHCVFHVVALKYWVGVQRGQSYLIGRRCLFSLGWPPF